jgi:predicted GNAT family acetyltransferase
MNNIKKGTNKFYIGETEDNVKAEVTFINSGEGVITVDHTFVSEELRGQNIAQLLIKTVIDFAREENLKIIPECSYAAKQFDKNPDYQDVLYK